MIQNELNNKYILNQEEKKVWDLNFPRSGIWNQEVLFIIQLIINDPFEQKKLTKELMEKIGLDKPLNSKYEELLYFGGCFEEKVKRNCNENTVHWLDALSCVHLIERKIGVYPQNDYCKTLFNLRLSHDIEGMTFGGGSEGHVDFCRILSNYAGNNYLSADIFDGLSWSDDDNEHLSEKFHKKLTKEFKEALFNAHNYNDVSEVMRAIKDVGDSSLVLSRVHHYYKDLIKDTGSYKVLINEFLPELENELLDQKMKSATTKKNSCKI